VSWHRVLAKHPRAAVEAALRRLYEKAANPWLPPLGVVARLLPQPAAGPVAEPMDEEGVLEAEQALERAFRFVRGMPEQAVLRAKKTALKSFPNWHRPYLDPLDPRRSRSLAMAIWRENGN
jgi:hypothetical protein